MIGLIIVGHGIFPDGILSSVELIAGKPQKTVGVNFEKGQGIDELKENIENAIDNLNTKDILILADLAGGSPFNVSVRISVDREDKNIKVVSGINLPMLLEAALLRDSYNIDQLTDVIKNSGIVGIKEYKEAKINQIDQFDDGI